MIRIGVTGGKGGTGKSLLATALAVELGRKKKTLLADLDVECPNDHLLLSLERKRVKDVFQDIPKFDLSKCVKCGKCSEVCRESAIVWIRNEYPRFLEDQCTGCMACKLVCSQKAITSEKKKIGWVYRGEKHGITLVGGEMRVGYEEASPVVVETKRFADSLSPEVMVIDTSAGTHCGVISALMGCDVGICVTEPTPFGKHDLELILRLLEVLGVPAKIVINRSDLGRKELIEGIAREFGVEIIGEIPYKKEILEAYSQGKPYQGEEIKRIARELV